MRYGLPGYLLFSPWPPSVRRRVRNRTIELQRVIDQIQAKPGIGDFLIGNLPNSIWYKTLQARRLIDEIRALQGVAMPDSIAALDRWSDEPRRGSNIVLRISHGALGSVDTYRIHRMMANQNSRLLLGRQSWV